MYILIQACIFFDLATYVKKTRFSERHIDVYAKAFFTGLIHIDA